MHAAAVDFTRLINVIDYVLADLDLETYRDLRYACAAPSTCNSGSTMGAVPVPDVTPNEASQLIRLRVMVERAVTAARVNFTLDLEPLP